VDKLKTVHYTSLCKAIIKQLILIEENWRSGMFKEIVETTPAPRYGRKIVTAANDCVVSVMKPEPLSNEQKLIFFDRRSQRTAVCTIIPSRWCVVTNVQIIVLWDRKTIEIVDTLFVCLFIT